MNNNTIEKLQKALDSSFTHISITIKPKPQTSKLTTTINYICHTSLNHEETIQRAVKITAFTLDKNTVECNMDITFTPNNHPLEIVKSTTSRLGDFATIECTFSDMAPNLIPNNE